MTERNVLQGTLVNVNGIGVLIIGQSGSGKSLAALSLMRSGRQLIADDLVLVRKQEPNVLIGQALEENVRIEVRGLGLFNARTLFDDAVEESCPIDIVVELTSYIPERDAGLVSPVVSQTTIMGCSLDKFLIPVATGMDPGFLIELLVRSKS